MSQPDLIATLRGSRPVAPAALRERVRLIAAETTTARRRITWRTAAVVLLPVAAAIAAAVVLLPRGGHETSAPRPLPAERALPGAASAPSGQKALSDQSAGAGAVRAAAPSIPTPSAARPQRYSASIELRLANAKAVSEASRRATQIVAALGGYPSSLNVSAGGRSGYASLVFRVPRVRVQTAVRRLSALGRIVNENVRIQDLGAQVDAGARLIARLQTQLTTLRAEPQTTETEQRISALTTRIEKLRRAHATTLRTAHYATVSLQLTTPARSPVVVHHDGHGPLHGLGVAFRWAGIGAVYALALGAPLAAILLVGWLVVRALRRRRVDALLSRS
jgi:hypothetical protein